MYFQDDFANENHLTAMDVEVERLDRIVKTGKGKLDGESQKEVLRTAFDIAKGKSTIDKAVSSLKSKKAKKLKSKQNDGSILNVGSGSKLKRKKTRKTKSKIKARRRSNNFVTGKITEHEKREHDEKDAHDRRTKSRKKRDIAIQTDDSLAWENGKVFYTFDEAVGTGQIEKTIKVMEYLEKVLCLEFIPYYENVHADYGVSHIGFLKFIISDEGCWSFIGNLNVSAQEISSCDFSTTILHEIMHSLGFSHEQTRVERDQYINPLDQNTDKDLFSGTHYTKYPINYDLSSVMHYGKFDFSTNGHPIYNVKDENNVYLADVSKLTLSYYDVMYGQIFYGCVAQNCSNQTPLACQNGGYWGYYDGTCKCICPEPTGGPTCDGASYPDVVEWPSGRYGIPMVMDEEADCGTVPNWTPAMRHQSVQPGANNYWWNPVYQPAKMLDFYTIYQLFCMADIPVSTDNQAVWDQGSYCIFAGANSDCPQSMSTTTVSFAGYGYSANQPDETYGPLPFGIYTNDSTVITFCCHEYTGNDDTHLPLTDPFYLIPLHGHSECPVVSGTVNRMEIFSFGTDDHNITGTLQPKHSGWWGEIQLYYCYYYPLYYGCGHNIILNSTNTIESITSPGWPNNYYDGDHCTWLIQAPEDTFIQITIQEIDVQVETHTVDCVDKLIIYSRFPGQAGEQFCGTSNVSRSVISLTNYASVVFESNEIYNAKGFVASVSYITEDDFCYNLADRGASYAGNVSYTKEYIPCVNWEQVDPKCSVHPLNPDYIGTGIQGGHSYCRNPDGGPAPWCYTDTKSCQQHLCDPCLLDECTDSYSNCLEMKTSDSLFCDSLAGFIGCHASCNHCGNPPVKAFCVSCQPPEYNATVEQMISIAKSSYHVGDVVQLSCANGGDAIHTIMCLSNGAWSVTDRSCSGCSVGDYEHNGHCFRLSKKRMSQAEAKATCPNSGYSLANIHDSQENGIVRNLIVTQLDYSSSAWIGLEKNVNGDWTWGGMPFAGYSNWDWGTDNDDCGVLMPSGSWQSSDCELTKPFVCAGSASPVSSSCEDVQDEDCPGLLLRIPVMCTQYESYAKSFCPRTCGLCADQLCKQDGCSVPPLYQNASLMDGTLATYHQGNVASYACLTGFVSPTEEEFHRVCMGNETWIGAVPNCQSIHELQITIGHGMVPQHYRDVNRHVNIIKSLTIPVDGSIIEWAFFTDSSRAVHFQVWRLVSDNTFLLVGETYVQTFAGTMMTIPLNSTERISAKAGDVLGWAYVSNEVQPLAYTKCVPTTPEQENAVMKKWMIYDQFPAVGETLGGFSTYWSECRNYSVQAILKPDEGAVCSPPDDISDDTTTIDHDGVLPSSTYYQSQIITYRCKPGLIYQSGDESRTCLADGTWSGAALVCL
ncbi:uncharacterized protein LOC141905499 [Tubulanus polymorphus]|uniref:uncharacterized protein LOC141905499 n=1 Tax=Tubulanus polymorphus TaxID=672921 RepID=UPI003DA43302